MEKRVGIIGAMEVEVELLRRAMGDVAPRAMGGIDFYVGSLESISVVVVRCGIGKVNAAMCAQMLVDRFEVTHLINTGVAGSLDAKLDIGDLVVASDCVQHDVDVRALGYDAGVIPEQDISFFPSDPALRETVAGVASEVAPEIAVVVGRLASGDRFVGDARTKDRIVKTFGACCCEMEGAAIAQVAHANGVPFVVVRAISDKADGSAHEDYPTFVSAAARRSATIVREMLGKLG